MSSTDQSNDQRKIGSSSAQAVKRGFSTASDPDRAVQDLASQLGPDLNAMIFFCGSGFDLDALGNAMNQHFQCPVTGCTTAGEIYAPNGYLQDSLVGIGFTSSDISMTPVFIPSLKQLVAGKDQETLAAISSTSASSQFAVMLIDGLSMLEERVVSLVQRHVGKLPLIGGSAGDGLDFRKTFVFHQGRFHSDAGIIALFETSLPFRVFRIQHFVPTETKLVITEADVDRRIVGEINGLPATEEYARIVGVTVSELSPEIFARHPLMLRIGGEYFVRSIQKANPDGSLSFYCAIANGLVLTLSKYGNLLQNLEYQLSSISQEISKPQLILGCDCILRRIELKSQNQTSRFKEAIAPYPYVGLNTYGEQYGGVHVNQTLTGLVLGERE